MYDKLVLTQISVDLKKQVKRGFLLMMLKTPSAICDLGSRSKQRKDPEEGAELRLVKGQRVVLRRATRWRQTPQPFGLTRVQPKAYKMTRNL